MTLFAEVILPLPLSGTFTYEIPQEMAGEVKRGHRVIVQFGKRKFYTGIVTAITPRKPDGYEVKPITLLLDNQPILRNPQLKLWEWVADYYLCSTGDVMKAALPAALKVESETFLEPATDLDDAPSPLSEREAVILQTLIHAGKRMSVADLAKTTGYSGMNALAAKMLEKGLLMVSEKLVERYVARKVTYVAVNAERNDRQRLHEMFDSVDRAPKQQQALLALLDMSGFMQPSAPLPRKRKYN